MWQGRISSRPAFPLNGLKSRTRDERYTPPIQPEHLWSCAPSWRLDAAHVIEPNVTIALDKGIAKIISNHLNYVSPRYLITGYVAKDSWIQANPEKAKRFVEAMAASTKFINEHPIDVIPILSDETKIDRALLARFFPMHYVITPTIKPVELQAAIANPACQRPDIKSPTSDTAR